VTSGRKGCEAVGLLVRSSTSTRNVSGTVPASNKCFSAAVGSPLPWHRVGPGWRRSKRLNSGWGIGVARVIGVQFIGAPRWVGVRPVSIHACNQQNQIPSDN
jgi:hypothetical protein